MQLYLDMRNGMISATEPDGVAVLIEVTLPIPNNIGLVLALLKSYADLPASQAAIRIEIGDQ